MIHRAHQSVNLHKDSIENETQHQCHMSVTTMDLQKEFSKSKAEAI